MMEFELLRSFVAVAECGGSGSTETVTIEDLERFAVSAPATNPASVGRFAAMNRARVPPSFWGRLEEATPADRLELAVEHATALCEELLAEGAPGLHLYTLNQSAAAQRIVANLGPL